MAGTKLSEPTYRSIQDITDHSTIFAQLHHWNKQFNVLVSVVQGYLPEADEEEDEEEDDETASQGSEGSLLSDGGDDTQVSKKLLVIKGLDVDNIRQAKKAINAFLADLNAKISVRTVFFRSGPLLT